MTSVSIDSLSEFMVAACCQVGIPETASKQISEVVLDSELRGHADHGVYFFTSVLRWITVRGVNPAPTVKVLSESNTGVVVDGGGGIGVEPMFLATDSAIDLAARHGMAAAVVRNTDNLIALAPYVQKAADSGMIALACSGFRAPLIPPTGGLDGMFGTNPFAFAAPAGRHPAFLLDIATSAIAGAKVMEARDRGETLPEGLLEDLEGNPITDPTLFKIGQTLFLPMAGVKGYGITMMVDILSTVLTGDEKWGHFIWMLDVSRFMPRGEFESQMDAEIDRIKSARRRDGVDEIYYAGERGQRRMAEMRAAGQVPLGIAAVNALDGVAREYGVPMPVLSGKSMSRTPQPEND